MADQARQTIHMHLVQDKYVEEDDLSLNDGNKHKFHLLLQVLISTK
jgi:hypothetical protein